MSSELFSGLRTYGTEDNSTSWSSLTLAIQHHIFTRLFQESGSYKHVASTLGLCQIEVDDILHRINLRQMYPCSVDHIRQYCQVAGGEISNTSQIELMDYYMPYMQFAASYEDTTIAELRRGKCFLETRGIGHLFMEASAASQNTSLDPGTSTSGDESTPQAESTRDQSTIAKQKRRSSRKHRTAAIAAHGGHKPLAFASYFRSRVFPSMARNRLLYKSPFRMCAAELLLVYGPKRCIHSTISDDVQLQIDHEARCPPVFSFQTKLAAPTSLRCFEHKALQYIVELFNRWSEVGLWSRSDPCSKIWRHFERVVTLSLYVFRDLRQIVIHGQLAFGKNLALTDLQSVVANRILLHNKRIRLIRDLSHQEAVEPTNISMNDSITQKEMTSSNQKNNSTIQAQSSDGRRLIWKGIDGVVASQSSSVSENFDINASAKAFDKSFASMFSKADCAQSHRYNHDNDPADVHQVLSPDFAQRQACSPTLDSHAKLGRIIRPTSTLILAASCTEEPSSHNITQTNMKLPATQHTNAESSTMANDTKTSSLATNDLCSDRNLPFGHKLTSSSPMQFEQDDQRDHPAFHNPFLSHEEFHHPNTSHTTLDSITNPQQLSQPKGSVSLQRKLDGGNTSPKNHSMKNTRDPSCTATNDVPKPRRKRGPYKKTREKLARAGMEQTILVSAGKEKELTLGRAQGSSTKVEKEQQNKE